MSGVKRYSTVLLGADIPVSVVDAKDYDTLRTANQRLEGEVARLREALANVGEGAEILRGLVETIKSSAGFIDAAQLNFLDQAADCIEDALAGDGGVSECQR
jgi:hypothetical protein